MISYNKTFLFKIPIVFSLIIFLVGCAKVVAPPGGKPDKTGPYIIGTTPQNGSTEVAKTDKIKFYFSEHVVKPEGDQLVFISPRPEVDPKIKWKSDFVEIIMSDSFQIDQTYIVTLTSDIKDLRSNKIDSSISIAFTTGLVLDSGSISGLLFNNEKLQPGYLVGLYDAVEYSTVLSLDSIYPEYVSQTNSNGFFEFNYLPKRSYKLVSFEDKNKNSLFNLYKENFAVTDRKINFESLNRYDSLYLSVTSQDTLKPKILSSIWSKDNLLKVRLTDPVSLDYLKVNPGNIILRSLVDSLQLFSANSMLEINLQESSALTFNFDSIPDGEYSVELTYDTLEEKLFYESVNLIAEIDIQPIEIIEFQPGALPILIHELDISALFSEPIDTLKLSEQTFTLWQDSLTQLRLERSIETPFKIKFSTPGLTKGNNLKLKMLEFEIADKAGNVLGDSIIEYSFSITDPDSLGSVSGNVYSEFAMSDYDIFHLKLMNFKTKQEFDFAVDGNSFAINLPEGKYRLTGFIDLNSNDFRDLGQAFPYQFAEPIAFYSDTINVRARFETAEIEMIFK